MLVSAPGKIILFGEHSVVYGRGAIASAIDLRTYTEGKLLNEKTIKIHANDLKIPGLSISFSEEEIFLGTDYGKAGYVVSYVKSAIERIFTEYGSRKGFEISIRSDIPVGAGLGSSAAVVVPTLKLLSELLEMNLKNEDIARMGKEVEFEVQGSSSGLDPAVSALGGGVYFKKGKIERFSAPQLPIIVGYTGEKGSTKVLLEKVKILREEYPEIVEDIMDAMEDIADKGRKILTEDGDLKELGKLMNINNGLLEAIGVSTKELSDLVFASRISGALGAKITGAGGGGCMYALTPNKRSEVETAIRIAGGIPIKTKTTDEGVRIEHG
ncbi:MAG TPA: mevalonate kinase [Methanofastidiosum sp.]|jgi:mevalonate kinase|nr:mevalonate kinase [Methanofastidiosum sp.]HOC77212.1 mevalonate kinase [Methanofastidiosum sp.]HQK63279.1 mevalonate kinase [Methanofastidiosum sp.]